MGIDSKDINVSRAAVIGRFITFKSDDDGETWEPVKPFNIPEGLKDPEVVGQMAQGFMAQLPGESTLYMMKADGEA